MVFFRGYIMKYLKFLVASAIIMCSESAYCANQNIPIDHFIQLNNQLLFNFNDRIRNTFPNDNTTDMIIDCLSQCNVLVAALSYLKIQCNMDKIMNNIQLNIDDINNIF